MRLRPDQDLAGGSYRTVPADSLHANADRCAPRLSSQGNPTLAEIDSPLLWKVLASLRYVPHDGQEVRVPLPEGYEDYRRSSVESADAAQRNGAALPFSGTRDLLQQFQQHVSFALAQVRQDLAVRLQQAREP